MFVCIGLVLDIRVGEDVETLRGIIKVCKIR